MFTFNKELDTTELIKWGAAVVGGVVIFLVINLNEVDNDNKRLSLEIAKENREIAKARKEAFENVTSYRPRLKIHYTNMLSRKRDLLNIRVFVEVKSSIELYILPPELVLYGKSGDPIEKSMYQVKNLNSYKGLFSPDTKLNIEYEVALTQVKAEYITAVKLSYRVESDKLVASIAQKYLQTFNDAEINEWASEAAAKSFVYREALYEYGENPIWNDFWENPR